jgi:hypothetical protein
LVFFQQFGIFYGYWVHSAIILNILPHFGMLQQENLATLVNGYVGNDWNKLFRFISNYFIVSFRFFDNLVNVCFLVNPLFFSLVFALHIHRFLKSLIVFMTGFFKKLAQGDNALCSH